MPPHVNPIRGEYVTAQVPVRAALLQSPDLLKYATPQKQITQPGLVTPEHFPRLVYLSLTILSLISSPPSGARKTYDKAELDTVKRKLDFGTSTTTKPAGAHEEMTSLNLETTSDSNPHSPSSNVESPSVSNLSAVRKQSRATPIVGDGSIENTVTYFSSPHSSHLTIVCHKHLVQSRNASLSPCPSQLSKEA